MVQEFKISPNMTKKEIIDKYTALLDAYKDAVQKAKEAEKQRSEAEKYKEAMAIGNHLNRPKGWGINPPLAD